jgi:hypothetical protein
MSFEDGLHKFAMNPQAIVWTAAALLPFHGLIGFVLKDYTYVDRCGALWVILGGMLVFRPILRVGYDEWYRRSRVIDLGTFTVTPEDQEEERQRETDARCVQMIGPFLGMMGTLLWAYGSAMWKSSDELRDFIIRHVHG